MDRDWNFCQLQPDPTQVSKNKDPTKPFNPQKKKKKKKTNKPGVGLDQVHQIGGFNESTHQRRTNKRTIKLIETIENN